MLEQIVAVLRDLVPLGAIGLIRHVAWLIKLVLSALWRDIRATGPLPYTKVGVAATIKGEPPSTFILVLESLLAEKIDQVCLTFDKGETALMELTDRFAEAHKGEIDIRWKIVYEKGKRKGLKAAIEMVEGMDIIVCMDSDTIFGKGVKESIMHAFSKPGIGGVTVAQRAYKPHKLMHYLFDIRLKLRYVQDIPGQALTGHISCLSGRCSAYLAGPLQEISRNLTTEEWLGIKKTGGGEDKCLTTFLMDAGYKCAVVVNSTVYTRPEASLKVYFSQSLRWARNSWFSDLRAIFTRRPWMVRDPILMFYTLDRMMSTFTLIWAAWYMCLLLLTHRWHAAAFLFAWWMISRAIKTAPWLIETRKFWVVLPYAFITFWLSFLKVHALVTLWETGWLTRETGKKINEAGQRFRDFSKKMVNNTYLFITAAIIVALGVQFGHNNGIWLADMPEVAALGNFYRPEDNGLVLTQDLFPQQGERSTLIVVNDPHSLESVTAALPLLVRLGDEVDAQIDRLRIVGAADLTAEQVQGANVVFAERPTTLTNTTSAILEAYDKPQLGERLLNTEPFASPTDEPLRVIRAPWDEKAWVVLADVSDQIHYRLNGQVLDAGQALTTVQNSLGRAFFASAPLSETSARTLASFDGLPVEAQDGMMSRSYRLLVTPEIDTSQLVLTIDAAAVSLLKSGAQIQLTLSPGDSPAIVLTTHDAQPLSLPLGQSLGSQVPHVRDITLTVTINREARQDSALPEGNFWRQFEAETSLTWQVRPSTAGLSGLDTFPYPFLALDQAPLVILLPDTITDDDLNLVARLAAHFGANGVSADKIHVMQSATLDAEILKTAHVIVLGSRQRQPLVQSLEAHFRQTNEIGMFDVLPNNTSGFVFMAASPWNAERSLIMTTGVSNAGEDIASAVLLRTAPITDVRAGGAIVDASTGVTPYTGFDRIGLSMPSLISDATPAASVVHSAP